MSVVMNTTNDAVLRDVQDHLALVLHAHRCQQLCARPDCAIMRNTLEHMIQCPDEKNCQFPLCAKSYYVILHWKYCKILNCRICDPSQHLSRNTWRQQIDRNLNIGKIISVFLFIIHVSRDSIPADQFSELQAKAKNIENNVFNTATSHDDYLQRMAKYLHQIQVQCKEKQMLKKQQQLETTASSDDQPHGSTNSPVDSNTSSVDAKCYEIAKSSEDLPAKLGAPTTDVLPLDIPSCISTTTKPSQKHSPVFSIDGIREEMTAILLKVSNQEDSHWFCFSPISQKLKENQYTKPHQFCEDVRLVFDKAWKYNDETHAVYQAATRLSNLFTEMVDPIMKAYGYCCGHRYVFLPHPMVCHSSNNKDNHDILPNDNYFVYTNPSGDIYAVCKKCFDSTKFDSISVNDGSSKTSMNIPKIDFESAQNDEVPEEMVDCTKCSRRFHKICILHHERIWPEGYICKQCIADHHVEGEKKEYFATELPSNELSSHLQQRVNDFLQIKGGSVTAPVTIRVLASNDRVYEAKSRFKKHFGAQVPDGYPYRTKAIFAFQKLEGKDVVLFGMHVQEHDGKRPGPNSKRVYISYLDSIAYFQPKDQRTAFYREILIGYLEYVKKLGFAYAHIWACPPKKGDDYIFHRHPLKQKMPTIKRLQKWYKITLDLAKEKKVVVRYEDIEDYADHWIKEVNMIPYFEGDFWPDEIENLLEQFEKTNTSRKFVSNDSFEPKEPTENSNKRQLRSTSTPRKKKSENIGSEITMTEDDFLSKIRASMKKQRKSFFIAWLHDPVPETETTIDPDQLILCPLIESRDEFLDFACKNHYEFSTLRRAKYSTMSLLIKLHSPTISDISYECDVCAKICDVRYHCTVCENYDLCSKCYPIMHHEHKMEQENPQ